MNSIEKLAEERVDAYLDMGCFKEPEKFRSALIEGFINGYNDALSNSKEAMKRLLEKYWPMGSKEAYEQVIEEAFK